MPRYHGRSRTPLRQATAAATERRYPAFAYATMWRQTAAAYASAEFLRRYVIAGYR